MKPTQEQSAILDALNTHPLPSCLLIGAGPGCAKSTTLVLAFRSLPAVRRSSTQLLAFNKEIASHLQTQLGPTASVATFNSFGLKLWARACPQPSWPTLNKSKTRDVLKWLQASGKHSIAPDEFDDLQSLVSMAKSQGYLPPRAGACSKLLQPPSFQDLCKLCDLAPDPGLAKLLDQALLRSIELAYAGEIDFDDQLYMPALFGPPSAFSPLSYLLVDEAQDLNPLQLHLCARLKARTSVFVGDPRQAIYAFRGAMSGAMDQVTSLWPTAIKLPLLTSFRIPLVVLPLLQEHNPGLTTASGLKGYSGTAHDAWTIPELLNNWPLANAGPSRAILCRNNAPLFRAALACLASGVRFHFLNAAFLNGLIRDIRKAQRLGGNLLTTLGDLWTSRDLTPAELETVTDKIACITTLLSTSEDPIKALSALGRVPNPSDATKPLVLSTAHKAKGLEFDWVLHLDPHLIPAKYARTEEQLAQEQNIAYVINSRTRHTLLFCSSDQLLIPGRAAPKDRPSIRKDQLL